MKTIKLNNWTVFTKYITSYSSYTSPDFKPATVASIRLANPFFEVTVVGHSEPIKVWVNSRADYQEKIDIICGSRE